MEDREFDEWLERKREFYFSKGDALEYIARCDRRAIAVIGIEIFHKRDSKLVADLDGICDWSDGDSANWDEYYQQRNKWSTEFVCALSDDRRILVTLVPLSEQKDIEYRRADEKRLTSQDAAASAQGETTSEPGETKITK